MYKVIIADDESSVTELLERLIDWEQLGLVIAGTASNGYEALGMCEKENADIAVLDIRMPGITGLELAAMLREKRSDRQVIILSGYADFEYARQAIASGVAGYCLKPVDKAEMTKCLMKAVRVLDSRSGSGERDILEYLESGDEEGAADILREAGIDPGKIYTAVYASDERMSGRRGAEDGYLAISLGRGITGMLSGRPVTDERFSDIRDHCRGIGLCSGPVSAGGLNGRLNECVCLCLQYFSEGKGKIFTALPEDSEAECAMAGVRDCIARKKWLRLVSELRLLKDPANREHFSVRSAVRLCNQIYTCELFRNEPEDYYVYGILDLAGRFESFDDMIDCLVRDIDAVLSASSPEETNTNATFFALLQYVDEHYREEMNLSDLSEHLHINPNYVSQLFRKETGVTLGSYVTGKRIADAKELLLTTKKSVADVAEESGFNDYFYFMKTFKKHVGMTPGRYRSSGGET